MEKINKIKKGGVRIMPKHKQQSYLVQHKYKGHNFMFFRDRGCIISKNLRKDYVNQKGQEFVVQDFDFDEIVKYFKDKGYSIIDLEDEIKNKKIVTESAKKTNIEARLDLNKNKIIKT